MKGFISYAHEDQQMFLEFRKHLRTVERGFDVAFWADDSIRAGHHWNAKLQQEISKSDVIILLISPAYQASDYIYEQEIPAIQARRQDANALVVPVVLASCDWQSLAGSLQATPMKSRRVVPITQWSLPEQGYDQARAQISMAVQRHFNIGPKHQRWFDPLADAEQELPGPFWLESGDQFVLDPGGGYQDMDVASDNVVIQLHRVIHWKADTLRSSMARLSNSGWHDLADAIRYLVTAIDRPTDEIPDNIATVWEASVRVASFIELDQFELTSPSLEADPLPPDIRRELSDLVGSIAPWVRRFPTACQLDEARSEFLSGSALLEPASRLLAIAKQHRLVSDSDADNLLTSLRITGRNGAQGQKAGHYGIRGARNLLLRSGILLASFIAGSSIFNNADSLPLIRRTGEFLFAAKASIKAILHDYPDDIRHAFSKLIDENAWLVDETVRLRDENLQRQAADDLEAELSIAAGGMLREPDVQPRLRAIIAEPASEVDVLAYQLLSVDSRGERLYPVCQFEGIDILEGIAKVLEVTPTTDGWRVLQFLLGTPDGLGGRRPIDLLGTGDVDDRKRVIAFAHTLED